MKTNKIGSSAQRRMSRRNFLLSGSTGLTVIGAKTLVNPEALLDPGPAVKYVTLGRTGIKVSNIGYGTSRGSLDPSTIAYAVSKGINYFDTSEGYGRGATEKMLGRAVKKFRDRVYITTKIGSVNAAGRLTGVSTFEEIHDRAMACLRRLDTPYIDFLFIHGAGDPDFGGFDNPNLDAVVSRLKSEGKIRHFGMSTHNYNLVDTVRHAVASGKVDVMLLAYNYFQEQAPEEYSVPQKWLKELNTVIRLAHSKNIGITTMKILQGAQESRAVKSGIEPLEAKKAAAKWSLNNPNVDVAVISLANTREIDAFVAVSGEKMGRDDRETLELLGKESGSSLCRAGCPAPCREGCPVGVAVPDVLRMAMYFHDYGWEKEAMLEYSRLDRRHSAEICASCTVDTCTENCMFSLNVKEQLRNSHAALSLDCV